MLDSYPSANWPYGWYYHPRLAIGHIVSFWVRVLIFPKRDRLEGMASRVERSIVGMRGTSFFQAEG